MEKKNQPVSFILFPDKEIVEASHGQTILQAVLGQGLDLDHSCGGMGTCGTCRVLIDNFITALPPRNDIETELAQDRGFEQKERLACQTCPIEGLQVRKP